MIYLGWMVGLGRYPVHFLVIFADRHLGARKKCDELGLPLLGDIPLHASICTDADAGKPTVVATPDSPQAMAFVDVAKKLISKLQL